MQEKSLVNQIREYIKNDHIDQAILIHGEWGSGKTYFIKEILPKKIDIDLIYTSANGISSEQSIILQIFATVLKGDQKKQTKGKNVISTILSGLIKTGINKIGVDTDNFNYLDLLSFDKSTVLVVDDLERLDSSYNIESFLGFINSLTEHERLKVILIAEENELKSRDEEIAKRYILIKEKHIFRTLSYEIYLDDVITNLIQQYANESLYYSFLKSNLDLIIDIWQSLKIKNLRTIKYFLDSLFVIYRIFPQHIEKIKRHIITTVIVLSKAYKESEQIKFTPELPDYLGKAFPSITSSIQRKRIEDNFGEDFLPYNLTKEFVLNHVIYYLRSRSLYQSIFFGQTDLKTLQYDLENFITPKDETVEWNVALNKIKDFRKLDQNALKKEYKACLDFIKLGKYDIYELSYFVNYSVEFIENKLISNFKNVDSFCKFIRTNLRKAYSSTEFNYSRYSRLNIEKANTYSSLNNLLNQFNDFNKLVVLNYTKLKINEVKSNAKSNLESISDQNILFIMREGDYKDLDFFINLLTSDIHKVNLAYDLFVHSQILFQKSTNEYKVKIEYMLSGMKKKACHVDKVVKYIVDEIIEVYKK